MANEKQAPPLPPRKKSSSVPPPLPPRKTSSSVPPPLPYRKTSSSVPPPLPPRKCIESGEIIVPSKTRVSSSSITCVSPRSNTIPISIPVPIRGNIIESEESTIPHGRLYEFRRWIKEVSKHEEYEIEDVTITGRKTSLIVFMSLFISILSTIIPIVTGDTELYDCEEDVCVLTGENNPLVFIFLSFYQYPWVLAAYFKTGLWMNASGINVKLNALYGHVDTATKFQDWERKDFLIFIDLMYLFVCLVAYVILYTQTQCSCGSNILMAFFMCSGVLMFPMFFGYAAQLQFSGYDPEHRMKKLKWIFFLFETGTSGVIYIGTYGYAGVLFMIVPILGYIESFGIFSW